MSERRGSGSRPVLLLAMPERVCNDVFGERRLRALAERGEVHGPVSAFDGVASTTLARTEFVITGWGSPLLDAAILDRAPALRAVLHAAGTVKEHLAPEVWERGVLVSSAAEANAVPVAQFTVAMILLAGKRALPIAARYRRERRAFDIAEAFPGIGNVDRRVGIVGASRIGRRTIALLRPFGYDVAVADPFLSVDEAVALGARLLPLDELVATSDILSIHAPSLPETHHLIDDRLIGMLRPGSTLINTARGEIVDQEALTARVRRGDLYAVLDVTTPWVLDENHPLYGHENVVLTPHIAGSLGTELHALADATIAELDRLLDGEPLRHPVRREDLATLA